MTCRPALRTPRHLLEPLDQPLALEARQPLDPEHPVQLIDLMLVADRPQTLPTPRFANCRRGRDS